MSLVVGLAPAALADGRASVPTVPAPVRIDHADRLELRPGRVKASGEVVLRLGRCRVRANSIEIGRDPRGTGIVVEQGCLETRRARLSAYRVRLDRRGRMRASWVDGELCRCGGWPSLRIRARQAWTAGDRHRLHLSWPRLRIGPVPVLALPYWALPLRPGTSGLLWPRVGYSERDGVRLEQGVYLALAERADLVLAGGWHQGRGPHLRSRLRYQAGSIGAGNVALLVLADGDRIRASAVGQAVAEGQSWRLAVHPDLVSDAALLADLAGPAARAFAPFLRSRLLGVAGAGPLSVTLVGDLFHDLMLARQAVVSVAGATVYGLGRRRAALHGRAEGRLALAPVSVAGPLLLLGEARWTATSSALAVQDRSPGFTVPGWLSLVDLAPALSLGWADGPLRLSATARYQLQLARREGEGQASAGHLLSSSVELGVPLARVFGRLRHTVEPFGGWRVAVGGGRWTAGGAWLEPRRGGLGLLGLRTRLARLADGRPLGRLRLAAALGEGLRLGVVELQAGRRIRLDLRATVPLDGAGRGFDLVGQLCASWSAVGQACAGYLRQRLGLGETVSAAPDPWGAAWALPSAVLADPMAASLAGALLVGPVDQLYGEARLRLWAGLEAGVSVYVDPVARELTHGIYRLSLGLGCGCYRVSALGRSRRGQRWPDVMLRLSLAAAAPGCD